MYVQHEKRMKERCSHFIKKIKWAGERGGRRNEMFVNESPYRAAGDWIVYDLVYAVKSEC